MASPGTWIRSWQPNTQHLSEIVEVLSQAKSPDNAVQQHVRFAIAKLNELPEAPCYLATILCANNYPPEVRQLAGLTLKNSLNAGIAENAEILKYIKESILKAVEDPDKVVRQTAGTVITHLLHFKTGEFWFEALTALVQALDNQNDDIVDGAFSTLCKVCEDELLSHSAVDDSPFLTFCSEQLLPKLFAACESQERHFCRKYAINCLTSFVQAHAFAPFAPFERFFPQYWATLGTLASEADPDLRKPVAQGMVQVLEFSPEAIFNSADEVFKFMVSCSGDSDYSVRLEALEFWPLVLRDNPQLQATYKQKAVEIIRKYLPTLLPTLVLNTVYSQWDYMNMDASQFEEDNASIPDLSQDLKPRFHHHKDDILDEDEDEDDQKQTWGTGWTVRKGSGLALDHLSTAFADAVLPIVLPMIEVKLKAESWEIKESAVLTLGAIAQGCMKGLWPFLPKVLEFLLELCDDSMPLLRSISCWCVSRFAPWITHSTNHEEWLKPVLSQLLKRILDPNKRVQEAACSAFATLEEEARDLLIAHLKIIIATLSGAFRYYQAKNLLILYDAVGTLAESVTVALQEEDYATQLMTPLFQKWQSAPSNDPSIIAIFECMTCCTTALSLKFLPYAPAVIERCIMLIEGNLNESNLVDDDSSPSPAATSAANQQITECSLDLLSGVTEALQENLLELLSCQKLNFLPIVERCCTSKTPGVLQSAFALVGDLSRCCVGKLKPHLPLIMPQLAVHLLHPAASVANNAGWAIGEIAVHAAPEDLEPYVDDIVFRLCTILLQQGLHISLLQSVCITLGRIGASCPQKAAVRLNDLLKPWCQVMGFARNDKEKAYAFKGICAMITQEPVALLNCLPQFFRAVLTLQVCPSELLHDIQVIVRVIRGMYPNEWLTGWSTVAIPVQEAVRRQFQID